MLIEFINLHSLFILNYSPIPKFTIGSACISLTYFLQKTCHFKWLGRSNIPLRFPCACTIASSCSAHWRFLLPVLVLTCSTWRNDFCV